jgi:cholinesterase
LKFLENSEPKRVVEESFQLLTFEEIFQEGLSTAFGPTIEPFHTEGVFLDDEIVKLVEKAWGNKLPVIIGGTSKEALEIATIARFSPDIIDIFANFENHVPRELNVTRGSDESLKFAEMLKRSYYGMMKASVTNIDGLIAVVDDLTVWYPAHRLSHFRRDAQTYLYLFDAESENNVFRQLQPLPLYRQPTHGDDFAHLFKSILHKPLAEMNQQSRDVILLMVQMFTNFACSGDPNPPPEISFHASNWEPIQSKYNLFGYIIQENRTFNGVFPAEPRVDVFNEIFEAERNATTKFAISFSTITFLILFKIFHSLKLF